MYRSSRAGGTFTFSGIYNGKVAIWRRNAAASPENHGVTVLPMDSGRFPEADTQGMAIVLCDFLQPGHTVKK